jgi:hypothetical protein
MLYTGYFISLSGISDFCGRVAGMVMPKGSMSIGREFSIFLCPRRRGVLAGYTARGQA